MNGKERKEAQLNYIQQYQYDFRVAKYGQWHLKDSFKLQAAEKKFLRELKEYTREENS